MAVAKDAVMTGGAVCYAPPASTTITNTNMTLGGSATALAVFIAMGHTTQADIPTISSVTCNGTNMPLIGSTGVNTAPLAFQQCLAYGLASPPTGSVTIVVNLSSVTGGPDVYVDAISFTGTDTTTPFPAGGVHTDSSTTTGTSYPTTAISVTVANGDAVAAIEVNGQANAPTPASTGGTAVQISNNHAGNFVNINDFYTLSTSTTTTMQWTGVVINDVANSVAFRVQQPTGGGVTTVLPPDLIIPMARWRRPPYTQLDFPFIAFTELAKEDIPKFGWRREFSEPVRIKPFYPIPEHQFLIEVLGFTPVSISWLESWVHTVPRKPNTPADELYTPIILAVSGTGNILWFQPLSSIMVQNTIGSD